MTQQTDQNDSPPVRSLITGGAGFIGSHLAQYLLNHGQHVLLLDDLSTGREQNVAHLLGQNCELIIEDASRWFERETSRRHFTHVYHLAAVVGVNRVVEQPVYTVETNLRLTQAAISAAAAWQARLLVASSSEVYGRLACPPALREDMAVQIGPPASPRWGYALGKALDEHLLINHARAGTLHATAVRLFNTIGPRQLGEYGMVVPRFIEKALQGQPLPVFDDGRQVRCFCDVRDVVRILHALLETSESNGQVVNVGSDRPVTMQALAQMVQARTGRQSEIEHVSYAQQPERADEPRHRVPDLTKLKQLIDYRLDYTLEDTLDTLIRLRKNASEEA